MNNRLRIVLLAFLIVIPLVFHNTLNKGERPSPAGLGASGGQVKLPEIALIFDDLGESLSDLKELYSLDIPLTVSVIPGLKFSKNIAHIAARCGFSVFIHLPLEPKQKNLASGAPYRFIGSEVSLRDNQALLRKYLNSIRIAIGVNNHMGSLATEDPEIMALTLKEIKNRGLIFIDSRTSTKSVAYDIANKRRMVCAYNEGFLDSLDEPAAMKANLEGLISEAQRKGKIIIIAHPKKSSIEFLKNNLPQLKERVRFITARDYFGL